MYVTLVDCDKKWKLLCDRQISVLASYMPKPSQIVTSCDPRCGKIWGLALWWHVALSQHLLSFLYELCTKQINDCSSLILSYLLVQQGFATLLVLCGFSYLWQFKHLFFSLWYLQTQLSAHKQQSHISDDTYRSY